MRWVRQVRQRELSGWWWGEQELLGSALVPAQWLFWSTHSSMRRSSVLPFLLGSRARAAPECPMRLWPPGFPGL